MGDVKNYYTPETKQALKEGMLMSPHTWLLINDPVHAYFCTGDDCRKLVNKVRDDFGTDQGPNGS